MLFKSSRMWTGDSEDSRRDSERPLLTDNDIRSQMMLNMTVLALLSSMIVIGVVLTAIYNTTRVSPHISEGSYAQLNGSSSIGYDAPLNETYVL